jgi:hypothetical protein
MVLRYSAKLAFPLTCGFARMSGDYAYNGYYAVA